MPDRLMFPRSLPLASRPATHARTRRVVAAIASLGIAHARASAQARPDLSSAGLPCAGAPDTIGSSQAGRPQPLPGTGRMAIALAAGTAALLPFDERIVAALRSPTALRSAPLRATMAVFDRVGAVDAEVAGPVLMGLGVLARRPALVDAGFHVADAYVLASGISFVAKGIAGRGRPYWIGISRASSFQFGRGFPHREAYASFPSGHAAGAFAAAFALSGESEAWKSPFARPLRALIWTAVVGDGVSRVYRDTHWATDVTAGAAVGAVAWQLTRARFHGRRKETARADAYGEDQEPVRRSPTLRALLQPGGDGRARVGIVGAF
ncbi:hypothetical protein tb265_41990 [Gemmatimonadetes bacterium T265]|nr:hypothetical protein tb265_41990 [Gemmatimonadetes bacterium T265]